MNQKRSNQRYLLYGLFAVCLVFCVFSPSLAFDFINWDDAHFVADNQNLDFTWGNLKKYFAEPFLDLCTPLTRVSFMIDHAILPGSALVCRMHNLLLHLLSVLLLFGIGRELRLSAGATLALVLLWGMNPQKVESVCWISERKDVLCGALAFGAMYAFQRAVRERRLPWGASILSALSILAKPASMTIGGVLFLYLLCRWRRKHTAREYLRFFASVAVLNACAICYSFAITFQTNPGHAVWRPVVLLHNVLWYPVTALLPFLPMTPCAVYPAVPIFGKAALATFTAGFALILAGVIVAYGGRRRVPRIYAAGWILAILCMILPVAGLLEYTNFTHCDRYNYLVSAVVLCGAASFLSFRFRGAGRAGRRSISIFMAVLVCVFAAKTIVYLPEWTSAERLFRGILERSVRYGHVPPNVHTVQNCIELWLNREDSAEHEILIDLLLGEFPAKTWECYADQPGNPVESSLMFARMHRLGPDSAEAQVLCGELFRGITEHRRALFSSLADIYAEDMLRFSRIHEVATQGNGPKTDPGQQEKDNTQ